jgi:hypothetical protein
MISDKVKIALLKAAPTLSHIDLIELVIEECQQAQRQWVGLTEKEIMQIAFNFDIPSVSIRSVEAKLKEKNT